MWFKPNKDTYFLPFFSLFKRQNGIICVFTLTSFFDMIYYLTLGAITYKN